MKNKINILLLSVSLLFFSSCSKSISTAKELDGRWKQIEAYENGIKVPLFNGDSIDGVFVENTEKFKNFIIFNYYNKNTRLEMLLEYSKVNFNSNVASFTDELETNSAGNFDITTNGKRLEIANDPELYSEIELNENLLVISPFGNKKNKNVYSRE
ncbi:MAG: hypothetical protein ACPGVH_06970 [Chitinophagales bacterium]